MALIACAECGQQISDRAQACPHCGCPVKSGDAAPAVPAAAAAKPAIPAVPFREGSGPPLAQLAIGFAATAIALADGPGLFWSLTSDTRVQLAPIFAGAFGLLLGIAVLPSWPKRIGLAVVSIPIYWVAFSLAVRLSQFEPIAESVRTWLAYGGAGLAGALMMTAATAAFRATWLMPIPLAAIAGLAGGLAFLIPAPGVVGYLAPGFIGWQILVGLTLVRHARASSPSTIDWPAVAGVIAVSLLIAGGGITVNKSAKARPAPPSAETAPKNVEPADDYAAAQWISTPEFLRQMGPVRIKAIVEDDASGLSPSKKAAADLASRELSAHHIQEDNDSAIEAEIYMHHVQRTFHGRVLHKIWTNVSFMLRTPVLRGSEFHVLEVAPVSTWTITHWAGNDVNVGATLQKQLAGILRGFESDAETGAASWAASGWTTQRARDLSQLFSDVRKRLTTKEDAYVGLASGNAPETTVSLGENAGRFVNADRIQQNWNAAFARAGLAHSDSPDTFVRYDLMAMPLPEQGALRASAVHTLVDVARVYQRDAVFSLNGRLYRRSVMLDWFSSSQFSLDPGRDLPENANERLAKVVARYMANAERR